MADSEAFSWIEGQIWVYSGNLATSAVVAYATQCNLNLTWGNVNQETLAGTYYDYTTGKRADFTFGAVMCFDGTLRRMVDSATALHIKFMHSSVAGTAGYMLHSGRIDSLQFAGSEKNPYTYTMAGHGNIWSGF